MTQSEFKQFNDEMLSPVTYAGIDQYKDKNDNIVTSGGHVFKGYVSLRKNYNLETATPVTIGKNKPKYYVKDVAFSITHPETGEIHTFITSASMTTKMRDKAIKDDGVTELDSDELYYAYIQHVPKKVNGELVPGQFAFFVTITHYSDAGIATTDIDFGFDQVATVAPATTETAPVAEPGTI